MNADPPRAAINSFDNWKALVMGLYMSLAGYAVLAGIPVISTAWSSLLGFNEIQIGRVAGADLGGLSVGAVIAAFLVARLNRRWLVLGSIVIAAGANIACTGVQGYAETLLLRFVSGVGSGLFTGVAVATLGGRSHPAKAYNYLLFAIRFRVHSGRGNVPAASPVDGCNLLGFCHIFCFGYSPAQLATLSSGSDIVRG